MLRTNQSFLKHIEQLYEAQQRRENIIVKSFPAGKKLLIQNEKPSKIMLIKDGITKCFFTEENDKEYILEFLGKGEIVGEIELIRNIPCICSVEAITGVTVYAISVPYFHDLLKSDFEMNKLLLNAFAERIVNTASRASYQQLYTTEYSLSKLLQLQSGQELDISKEDMAAYLGITIRSLNRAMKEVRGSI